MGASGADPHVTGGAQATSQAIGSGREQPRQGFFRARADLVANPIQQARLFQNQLDLGQVRCRDSRGPVDKPCQPVGDGHGAGACLGVCNLCGGMSRKPQEHDPRGWPASPGVPPFWRRTGHPIDQAKIWREEAPSTERRSMVAYIIIAGFVVLLCHQHFRRDTGDDSARPVGRSAEDPFPWSRWRRPRDIDQASE